METIVCEKCNSEYQLSYQRIPVRDKDYIICEICGTGLYSWNEAKIWSAELIKRGDEE